MATGNSRGWWRTAGCLERVVAGWRVFHLANFRRRVNRGGPTVIDELVLRGGLTVCGVALSG